LRGVDREMDILNVLKLDSYLQIAESEYFCHLYPW
jgi:hypothetical protein